MKTKRKIKLSFSSIKAIIGSLFIIAGILGGLYVGIWIMFVGGILGIAQAIDAHTITATIIGINAIKILLASLAGYIVALVGMGIGSLFLADI